MAGPSLHAYETLSHKSELLRLARNAGLQIPEGREVHNVSDAAEVARDVGWPVVVKPVDGTAMRDRKMDQLRDSLASTVTVVHQLGIGQDEAISLFRALLDEVASGDNETEEKP